MEAVSEKANAGTKHVITSQQVRVAQKKSSRLIQAIRKAGLILTAISGAVLAAPVHLPQLTSAIFAYAGVLGTIAVTVSKILSEDGKQDIRQSELSQTS